MKYDWLGKYCQFHLLYIFFYFSWKEIKISWAQKAPIELDSDLIISSKKYTEIINEQNKDYQMIIRVVYLKRQK